MPYDKIDQLYDALKADGAVSKSRENFRSKMLAPGKEGYQNRLQLYDALKADGAVESPTYEGFAKRLGLHAVKSGHLEFDGSNGANKTNRADGTNGNIGRHERLVAEEYDKSADNGGNNGRPMTEQEKIRMLRQAESLKEDVASGMQRFKNKMSYVNGQSGLRVSSTMKLGQNNKVVGSVPLYNAKTGKTEQTFYTESGNEYDNRAMADVEQNATDQYKATLTVEGLLKEAEAEKERLEGLMRERMAEIDKNDRVGISGLMRGLADESHGMPGNMVNGGGMRDYRTDKQYLQLEAAARKNALAIQILRDKKESRMNDFWHSMGTSLGNGYTFTDGLSDMNDATALTGAQKHIDAINKKRAAGKPLTKEEEAAEAVLHNAMINEQVQGLYGGEYGAWSRAGSMFATSLDMMKDIMLTPGAGGLAKSAAAKTTQALGKGVAKVAGKKVADNIIAKGILKGTGILVGSHAAGALVSNTSGIGHTFGEMGNELSGHVAVDKEGNYTMEGQKGLLRAFADAERTMIRENGSEMFGNFIPGGKIIVKGLEKLGLSRISNVLTKIGNNKWYENYCALLRSGGFNGIPGEALEEYEGLAFDALTGHADEAWEQIKDLDTHIDIWLGTTLMSALLGGVPVMMHGRNRARYYWYKNKTNDADKVANYRLGKERWPDLRDKIDETPNEGMTDMVIKFLKDNGLHAEEKKSVLNYIRNLTKMRGYNLAETNNADKIIENGIKDGHSHNGWSEPKIYRGRDAEVRLQEVLAGGTGAPLPEQIGTAADFEMEFAEPVVSSIGELVKVGRNVYDKIIRNKRENITGAIRPTLENSDFVLNDKDESHIYIKMYNKADGSKAYNVAVVNKKGDVEDYVSSVHIKSDGNLINKIRNGAELSLPSKRTPYGDSNPNSPTSLENNPNKASNPIASDKWNNADTTFSHQSILNDEKGTPVSQSTVPDDTGKDNAKSQTPQENPLENDYLHDVMDEMDGNTGQSNYENGRLMYDRFADGDPTVQADIDAVVLRMQEAYEMFKDVFPGTEAEYHMASIDDPGISKEQREAAQWALVNDPELTAEQQDAVLYYINAKAALDGVMDASNEAADRKRAEVVQSVEKRTHKDNGMVIHATMKVDDRQVYIVKGDVVMFPDGTAVDVRNSSESVVVMDAESGEYEFASPDQIFKISDAVNPQEELDAAMSVIEQERMGVFGELSDNNLDIGKKSLDLQSEDNEYEIPERVSPDNDRTQDSEAEPLSRLLEYLDSAREEAVGGEIGSTYKETERGSEPSLSGREIEARAAERYAKEAGVWVPMDDVFDLGSPGPSGNENDTYISPDNQYIYKVNNLMNSGGEISRLLEKVRLHNKVFPESSYEFVGFTGFDGRSIYPIIRQRLVTDAENATPEEIDDYMRSLGFEKTGDWKYDNRVYEVGDLRPRNVLKDADRDIYVIDAEISSLKNEKVSETAPMTQNEQTALSRIPMNEHGEPRFEAVDKDTAWDGLVEAVGDEVDAADIAMAQIQQANNDLETLKKKQPTQKIPKLKGSPMAMAEAKRKAAGQYQQDLAQYNQQIAEAQARLDAWNGIVGVYNSRNAELRRQREEERRQRDAIAHDKAVARFEEEQRIKAEKQAEQERIGVHAVNPKIKEKWDAAPKVEGNADAITLPDGSTLTGRYVLTEAGAASPSHDVNNAYQPTEGFPIDENGQSVNDRDYMRDKDAQQIVDGMASNYDNRALQDPVIVSRDGVVLSGNNRTMSGDLAAGRGTDKAYVDYLAKFGHRKYGFTPEQVTGMKNPRVVFVPDEALPYDATTFARFNAQEKKSQGKPEAAVKLGKIVPDNVFNVIVNDISRYDRLSDYYADEKAVAQALGALMQAGVINDKQMPEMRTGTALSAAGKELIENTLIGKIFQASPDAVRQIISVPTLRQSIVMGLSEIANNRTLARNGYDISDELSKAVDLVARAKTAMPEIYKDGMPVSPFGRMQGLFDNEFGDSRVTDGTALLLADILNSGKPSDLRKVLSSYNNEAAQASGGQIDIFSGTIPTKEEILTNVNEHFRNATPKEQQALVDAAIAERKHRAEADAEQRERSEASEQTPHDDERRAEPQQPVAGDTELEPLGKDRNDLYEDTPEEAALRARISVGEEWEEEGPAPDKPIYKRKLYVDGKHEVIQTDAPDKNGSYTGSQLTFDGRDFGDLKEIADYIDGGMQAQQAEPTEAQKAAGNYKMEHRRADGYNISIENAKGSVRRGTGADGKPWETTMQNDYGYIRGTEGVDGDHIDVFLSDTPEEGDVFVVDQVNEDGSFDEHKVMYGFPTEQAARDAYLSNYEPGWTGLGAITHVSKDEFKKWIQSSRRKTKPFAEYKSVKAIEGNGMIGRSLTEQEATELIARMEATAKVAPTIELTPENWIAQFGEDGTVETPIGTVKMGENQYFKMARQGREGKLGMVKPTLQNPDVVVEDYRPATAGVSERDTSYIFVKTFCKEDGSRYYYFTSVTVRKEGREVVISNQERSDKRISKLLQQGKVAWIDNGILHPKAQVGKSVSLNDSSNLTNSDNGTAMLGVNSSANNEMSPSSERYLTEAPSESGGPDLVPTSDNIVKGKEREDGQSLILPSESSEEAGALSGPTLDSPSDRKVNTLSADKQTESAESSEPYTITATTYTNKKGKTSDVHLVKFNRELTAEEKAALDTFAREPLTEGKKTSRGWYDRKQGGYMMRSEESARQLAEMIGNEEAVADAQPMTAEELREAVAPAAPAEKKPARKPKKAHINRVSLEDVMTDLSTKGETKLSDHAEPVKSEPEQQHEISDDEMKSLADELRDLLGIGDDEGDTNIKFRDPGELTAQERQRIQSAGIRLAMGLIERGTTAFPDYATKMVGLLGDKIRPWLKSFYEGARWTPGYDKYTFTPTEQVATFDVQNFDKKQADPIAQAAMIVEERKASTASAQAQKELTETRNKNRRENDKQTEADTIALAEKAEAVAGEAEVTAQSAGTGEAGRKRILRDLKRLDDTLEEVNDQLAILGYYEAEEVDKDFNEAYGYMRNAEKKAVKDAVDLAKQLVNDLGLGLDKVTGATTANRGKRKNAVTANIAPAGGDISIRLPLNEGRELYITIGLDPSVTPGDVTYSGDNLQATRIMYRVEWPDEKGHVSFDRMGRNCWADANVTYADLLNGIQREAKEYLPKSSSEKPMQELVDMAERGESPYIITPEAEAQLAKQHKAEETHNGYKIGDEVMWDHYDNGKWEKVKIEDFDADGSPIFEAVKGVMSEKGDWSRVKAANGIFGEAKRVARATQEKKKKKATADAVATLTGNKSKKSRKKDVTLKPEQPIGDLFSGLFYNPQNSSNHEETEMGTRPGEAGGQRQQLKQDTQVGGDEPRRETERPAGEAGSGSTGMDSDADRAGGRGLHDVATQPALERLPEKERKNVHNNHVERGTEVAPKSESARIKANIAAIETMKKLEASGEAPTAADMKKLRAFSGWGGLGKAFSDWDTSRQLRQLLGDKLYDEGAEMSRNSAYFTPAYIVDAMWDIARAMGFKGGRVLEGSAGIGNILGLMPQDLSERSYIRAVEKDPTTGKMLSLLYPDAVVDIDGFEKVKIETGTYDLVITNVPFVPGLKVADTSGDADISKEFKTSIHDFCIAKNVRKLRDGGVGVFITTAGSMDGTGRLYKWLANRENADIVGMFRMHNETFGGTNATSDIIVVRKRVNGVKSPLAIDCSLTTGVRTAEYNTGETKKVKNVGEVPIIKTLSMSYNRYYVEHPEYMAGEMHFGFEKGDTSFRPESKGLYPVKEKDQSQLLSQWVEDMKRNLADTADETAPTVMNHRDEYVPTYDKVGNEVKTGTIVVDSQGRICVNYDGTARPLMSKLDNKSPKSADERIAQFNKNKVKGRTRAQVVQDYNAIKKALNDLLEYQKASDSDEGLQPKLKALNRAFDSFVATYGHLHGNKGLAWLKNDVDYPSVIALETYREEGLEHKKVFGKADIFSRRVVVRPEQPKATNVRDGVTLSIRQTGSLDTRYIAEQLGMNEADVRREVIEASLGYENPLTHSMEAAHEYLSGNVREKMQQAEANNEDGRYTANITALRKVVPHSIPSHFIEFSIGSSWLRPELFEQYVKERTGASVKLTYAGGMWAMDKPRWTGEQDKSFGIRSEICDKVITGTELIEAAMTNRTIRVSKRQKDGPTISDPKATSACAAKVDEIRDDFKSWLRSRMEADPELAKEIEERYNDIFNNSAPMTIPDEYIPEYFDGAARVIGGKSIKMREHQAKAIVRGTMQSLMLAHEVGTGKTFTLITTAMEMRRLGTAKKPMIVVQNATLGQFVASAKALYPDARILSLEDRDRNAEGRKDFYAKIRYNDWDMVVIPQSVLERIPDHPDRERRFIEESIQEKMDVIEAMSKDREAGRAVAALKKDVENLRDQLNKLSDTETADDEVMERVMVTPGSKPKKDGKRAAIAKENAKTRAEEMLNRATDDTLNFDDLGVDAILVDEAHEYKHLGFATAMQRGVKGVDPSYSKKCQGLYLKVKAVQEKSGGRNVIFATGTPISNTAAEVWTFMRYLLPREVMEGHNIWHFDDFVRNFGSIQQMLEFTTQGTYKENNRFAGYSNLPELARIWAGITDTVLTAEAGEVKSQIPELEGGQPTDLYLPQTNGLRAVLKFVRAQLKAYDEMSGQEKKENSHIPLVMYGIAKAAAIDARLVMANAPDDPHSKTNEAVRQTLRSLEDSKAYNGTVAIFADNYQRKNKETGAVEFNLFDDIRTKLIAQGVPAEQVVIMRDGMTDKAKEKIFAKVNAGEIRVILGTTQRLGVGVNIQERLHTLMHIDAPNRPMDYWQRMGRLLRQGNMHKEMGIPVRVIRFGVEDSLDVTAYQRLKTKGAIADAIMHSKDLLANNLENRILEEEGDEFGNITAELSGSQYAMLQNQTEKELRKLQAKQDQHRQHQMYIHRAEPRLRELIEKFGNDITRSDEILALLENNPTTITINGKTYESRDDMQKVFEAHNKSMASKKQSVQQNEPITSTLTFNIGNVQFTLNTHVSQIAGYGGQGTLAFDVQVQHDVVSHDIDYKRSFGDIPLKRIINELVDNVTSGKEERSNREAWVNAKERNETDLAALLKDKGKPFEHGERIKELEQKLEEYTIAMQEELREKEAKYAEMDANIEDATDITFTSEDDEDEDSKGSKSESTGDGNKYRDGEKMSDGERLRAIRGLEPIEVKRNELSKAELREIYNNLPSVEKDGREIEFYRSAFKKIYKEGGLFGQVVPILDEVLEKSVLAYSERDNLGGTVCRDGTIHKEHDNIIRFDNYVGVISLDGRSYFVRTTVQNEIERSGTHAFFVSNVDVYENPTESRTIPITSRGTTDFNGIVDAKLQQFFERASSEAKILDMRDRVEELSEKTGVRVRVIIDESELTGMSEDGKPRYNRRERRAKGWWSAKDDEVVIVLPNNVNVADVDNTFVHEVAGHKGLRALVGEERFDEFLGEIYDHASNPIRKVIDKMTDRMVSEEADRLRTRKAQAHERAGEDVNANYYTDMAEARVEAEKKREDFRKEATEEYMSDLGGRIGSEGFEKMSRDEQTLWGKIKAKVQSFLDKFLRGLKIAKSIRLNDKDLSYILFKSWKNMREKQGKGGVFADAEDAVMRRRTGWDDAMLSESAKVEDANNRFNRELQQQIDGTLPNGHIYQLGNPGTILRSTGVPNLPIQMSATRLRVKATEYGHDFDLAEIRNIVNELQTPMAVFAYGNKGKMQNIIVGIESNGKQFIVGLSLNPIVNGKALEINSVRNVFPKNNAEWLNWISQGKLLYADKQKIQALIDKQRTILADVAYLDLEDVAKVIKTFENPTFDGDEDVRFRDGADYVERVPVMRRRTGYDEAMLSESAKIEDANKAFNRQLNRYMNGEMGANDYIEVGKPLGVMRMFLSDVPIVVRQRVLHKASVTKHNVDLAQLLDLPGMIAKPIFVFQRDAKTLGVLTELRDREGKNVCVAIELNRSIQSGAEFLEVNDIRSLHGRDASNIVLPIVHNNTLQYADKKKGLAWLSSASSNYQQEIAMQDLESATKIIKKFENPTIEGDEDVKFRDGADYVERNPVMARAMYEKRIQTSMYQMTEAMQDSMRGLMEFYKAVESQDARREIEDVSSFENAYIAENLMSSKSHAEMDEYEHRIMRPLLDIAARMSADKKGRLALTDYMMAKHGLERNAYMRNEAIANGEESERDFAGLCGLTGEADWQDAEVAAQQIVSDYEWAHSADIAGLWNAVNTATKASLKKVYDCGLLGKEQYEKIRDMYDYYIPLRGFDEKTSDDVYGYLTSKEGAFSSPIKKAEGRKSKADDPLATIAYMAQNSIIQGNRNVMKQKFLTYVQNHPSDLASVNRLWLVHDETTDIWKPVFADIDESMTPSEIDKAVMEFEERMESLSQSEPDKYKRGRDAIGIPYRIVDGNIKEHQVVVKRNGESFVITINGNPRAAQAVNGLTNPDNDLNGAVGKVFNIASAVNRQLSQFYTTRNPDFVVSNFIRDLIYSNTMVHVKENQGYAMKFHKNHAKVNPIRMVRLLRLYEANSLNMHNPIHRMFYEFMHWGGETGYTMQRDLEQEKKLVAKIMKEARRGTLNPMSILSLVGNKLDQINRGVENSARFAAFVTSREIGRDVQRSAYDAKEISVNFNKKGAGSKFMDATGQTAAGKTAGFTSGLGRSFYVFWNAAVQGTANYGKAFKKNPVKAMTVTTALLLLGYVMAALMDDGDDEDKNGYYNMPKYTRRSNLMFRTGEQWVTIPLPVEYRALYGLGELAYSVTSGREEYSDAELAKETASQLSQLLPLDFMEGGGGLHAFVPSAFKPIVESATNTSWTGLPLYKDTPFNKDMPEWTKAYPRTNSQLVDLSKWANEASGGNDYKAGWANFNPSQLEYLLNGYFGGYSNVINKMVKTGETMLGERDYDPSSILLVNRLVKMGDERTAEKKINSDFFQYLEDYKRTHTLLRKYEDEAERGSDKYRIFLDALKHSRDGARHDVMDEYIADYNWLNKTIKNPEITDEERTIYEEEMRRLKREAVSLMKVAPDSLQMNRLREQFAQEHAQQ